MRKRGVGTSTSISGLVVEYIVAIDVTWVRFLADAIYYYSFHLRTALRKVVAC